MPAKKKATQAPEPETFEQAIEELEAITNRLEDDPGPLEQLLKDFEKGQTLLRYCQSTLQSARERLDVIEAKIQTEDVEDDSDESTEPTTDLLDNDVRLF